MPLASFYGDTPSLSQDMHSPSLFQIDLRLHRLSRDEDQTLYPSISDLSYRSDRCPHPFPDLRGGILELAGRAESAVELLAPAGRAYSVARVAHLATRGAP